MSEIALEKYEQRSQHYFIAIRDTIVHNEESLRIMNERLKGVKELIKGIKDYFAPMKKKTKAAHDEIVSKEKEALKVPIKAEGEAKIRIASYLEEQEKKQREAARKAQEEEEKRLAAVHVMMEEAEHMEEKGQAQEARELRARIPEQKITVIPETPKLEGTHVMRILKWEVIDLKKVPVEFLMIDRAKVTAYVNAHKERTNIPGIRVYTETSVAVRT